MTQLTRYENGDKSFYCTPEQADVLDTLKNLHKGGIGTVYGYVPSSDSYITVPKYNAQFITRFSTAALYERKRNALEAINYSDVLDAINADPVLKLSDPAALQALFVERKGKLIESLQQTLDGDRSGGHRQGHDRCYATVADGVKVNFDCVKDPVAKVMVPKLVDGLPVAESIMLPHLELSREYVEKGEYKTRNSGAPVRMTNAIESQLNKRSVGIKMLSLKPGNFESLKVSRTTIKAEDLKESEQATNIWPLIEAWLAMQAQGINS